MLLKTRDYLLTLKQKSLVLFKKKLIKFKVEGTNLKIYGVRLENAGSYECVATNKDGESRSPAKITVKKVELPLVRYSFIIQNNF